MSEENIKAWSVAYQTDRVKLIDAIPLDLPLCVCIEPTNICNFKCLMCWQSTNEYHTHGGPFINMSMDLFDKVIGDLKEFCKNKNGLIKLIKLYSTGEPLLNNNISEMLKKIKAANICKQVEITTNGALLTRDLAKSFVDLGLDYLRVSIYSVLDEGQKRVTQSKVTPKEIRANIKYLKEYRDKTAKNKPFICAKIMDTHSDENEQFVNMYKDVSDEQIIDTPWILPKLEENALDKLYGEKGEEAQEAYLEKAMFKQRKACRYPFTHITIRSNGDAVVCCTDWSRDTKLGNVLEKKIQDIWNSKELYNFRVMMLKTKGIHHPICATCELPLKDCKEDNIDGFPIEKLSYKKP